LATHDDVGLLDRTPVDVDAGYGGDLRALGGAALYRCGSGFEYPARAFQSLQNQPADVVVLQSSRCGHNQLIRTVVPLVVVPDSGAGHGHDRLGGAADGPAKGVARQDGLNELLMADVRGIVIVHRQFFENDVAFLLQLAVVEHGGGDHVRDDVDGHRQIGIEHAGVVAGVFLRRRGIGFPADLVKSRRDVKRRAPLRSLEQQVLQEVRRTVLALRLVPGANADPEADGCRTLPGHRFRQHSDAAGEHGTPHHGAARITVDQRGIGPA
jgi:hypothetical protein